MKSLQAPAGDLAVLDSRRATAVAAICIGAIGVAGVFSIYIPLAAVALCVYVVMWPAAPFCLLGFFILALGLPSPLSHYPISLGAFQLYGVDLMLPLLGWAAMYCVFPHGDRGTRSKAEWVAVGALLAFAVYGLFHIPYGLASGYLYDEVFGDYRRYTFYMLAMLLPLWIPLRQHHLRLVSPAIVGVGLLVAATGALRVVTNSPARLDENLATGHVGERMLTVAEFQAGALALAYLTVVLLLNARMLKKVMALVVAGAVATMLLLSGFRAGMLFAVIAPVGALVMLTWVQRWSWFRLGLSMGAGVLLLIPVALFAGYIFRDQFEKMVYDIKVRQMDAEITGDYRQWTWSAAYEELKSAPIVGVGYGHVLSFANRTRAGVFEIKEASPHSSAVAILYQTGLVGILLWLLVHVAIGVAVLRHARSTPPEWRGLVVALAVGGGLMVLSSCVQPLDVAGYAAIYLAFGFLLRILRLRHPEAGPMPVPETQRA